MEPCRYLGVDLGGTKTAVSLWAEGPSGPVRLGGSRWPTSRDGPGPNLDRIVDEARRLALEGGGSAPVAAIGISGGGPLDPEAGEDSISGQKAAAWLAKASLAAS